VYGTTRLLGHLESLPASINLLDGPGYALIEHPWSQVGNLEVTERVTIPFEGVPNSDEGVGKGKNMGAP
jgi:hypothetical protein